MLISVNPAHRIAVLRLQEFLEERRPWNRALWGIGVTLAMDELYEACAVVRQGHLSEGSVKRMITSLLKRVGSHPAFSTEEKRFLQHQLQQLPRAEGPAHLGIRELSARVSADYLKRWGAAVTTTNFSAVEQFARDVAAYLLDAGFAGLYFHNFIKSKLASPEQITLQQLCQALQTEVDANPRREFEVLMGFTTTPRLPNGIPDSWLQGPAVNAWLTQFGFDTSGIRVQAAKLISVRTRDAIGAAQAARNESERYAARQMLATGTALKLAPWLWVKGSDIRISIKEDSRGVGVRELFREDRVFSTDGSQSVDAALELLAHLEESSPAAAVAGGWGAIEGLLADPNDRASAADNLATLVTCSFPRAELTALSYRVAEEYAGQYPELEAATTNRARCRILAQMIIARQMPQMASAANQAAVVRLDKLLTNPTIGLQIIRDTIGESFHRLYRQRNLILHGGRLDSVALSASLRTVAKLVGAGMDRITHGQYVQDLKPLELVAKANLALALVSSTSPLDCVDLLEIA